MDEIETIDALRSSLARRRTEADQALARSDQAGARFCGTAQLSGSTALQFALRRPAIMGIAAGALYLVGPPRLLRVVTSVASIIQAAVIAHAAYRQLVPSPAQPIDDEFD